MSSDTLANLIPLPLASPELVELRLELIDAALLEIQGRGIEAEPEGEGRLIEELPSELPSDLR